MANDKVVTPPIPKGLVEWLTSKVKATSYSFGSANTNTAPQEVAFIAGQMDIITHLRLEQERQLSSKGTTVNGRTIWREPGRPETTVGSST